MYALNLFFFFFGGKKHEINLQPHYPNSKIKIEINKLLYFLGWKLQINKN